MEFRSPFVLPSKARRRVGALLPLVLLLLAIAGPAVAQPFSSQAVDFAVTPDLSSLPPDEPSKPGDGEETKGAPVNAAVRFEVNAPDAVSEDPVVQDLPVVTALTPPLFSFEGLNNTTNGTLLGFQVSPPDTVGDVGPNHYVEIVNLVFRVFDKAGTPLTAPLKFSTIFSALGPPCAGRDDGDPIVLYDPLADRWLLSQFCTVADPNDHQVIAISQTSNPAGAYFLYDFRMPNNKFNDYPKFGVWTDAYYMTDNQFNQAGTLFQGAGAFAFNRAKMLAGDPTANYVYFDVENGNPAIGGMLPADIDGITPPPIGSPGMFAYFVADEFGDPADGMRIFELRPNFATPASSTFTERTDSPVLVAPFDPRSPTGRDDVEQPSPAGSTSYLDAISDRLMFRLAYRNFGTHESLVVNHTVNVSGLAPTTPASHQAGVRYYEFRRPIGGNFFVQEQATFAPDSNNRWMGSAAQDNDGNLAVGYSVSSLSVAPSIRYAGRLATDPPNGLFQGEASLITGTGVQTNTGSRWGDYSALSVDPADDCTFWYTTEYYTAASQASSSVGWLTRIGTFVMPGCTPAEKGAIAGGVFNSQTAAPIPGATVQTTDGYVRSTGVLGTYSITAGVGTYDMVASAPGYSSDAASGVSVTNGNTTVQNFFLTPMPILQAAPGAAIVAESCGTGSGAIDPGETVTVSLPVRNVGTAATVNLVGTLLSGGGVTSPGAAQTYGVVGVGGTASRPFTFTASGTCGGQITLSVQLQDGASNLGTVTYTFTLGTLNPLSQPSSASSGAVSAPIPDLGTVDVPISVTDVGAVSDVNVKVRLNHTFTGDLILTLISPDGTQVQLSNRRGGSGQNFGTGANDCSGTPSVFDDEASVAISAGTAPFTGSFIPDQPLSAFDGKPTAGTWKLRVSDNASLDVGTVFCVQLELSRRVFACCGTAGSPAVVGTSRSVTGESCSPANGAIDPDETVNVSFALANAGSGPTTGLVATLLPGGGVLSPSAPQSYGVVPPDGSSVSRTFSFVPTGTCGGNITATLHLQDGPFDLGTVSFTLRLGTLAGAAYGPFANPGSISIPNSGNATPYPSSINVSGISGTVTKVTASLSGFNHTFPADVDVLLAGPAGQRIILMSDVGGGTDAINVNLTFDDSAPAIGATVVSGTFHPTNSGTGDTFPAPAPAAPFGANLADFNGTNPNGTWRLFVVDDAGGDLGSFAGGWSLRFQTADPVCCSQACSLACSAPVTQGNDPDVCQAAVIFASPGVTGSCGVVACAPPSGSIFSVGTTTDVCTATTQGGSTTTCNFPITVNDVQGPIVTAPTASPAVLTPPEHQMKNVTISYTTADNCTLPSSITCALSVASNEPINGLGDGDTAPDWQVIDAHHVKLRAERSGTGTGRIYTVTVTCKDAAGVSSSRTVTVSVPHD
ncbi:MAG TPA: proprotein convertase P-domain-containing protein [Thermoanaerobaculia bacterium]|nr:proprotein convertase P-domain-containing protein [Thermoanaerobaculia bacterium]